MTTSSPVSSTPRLAAPRLRALVKEDRAALHGVILATGAFNAGEVDVALELIDLGIAKGDASGYLFTVAELDGQVVGYACFGDTPLTDGVYDLYWIAVHPRTQGHGVGRALLQAVDAEVRAHRGRMVLIETAGKPSYQATRAFYEKSGCDLVARVPDFYAVGDDKLIYARRL